MHGSMPRSPLAFCVVGGRAIFLDVDGDRYFHLPADLNAAFVGSIDNPASVGCEVRARLARLGVAIEGTIASRPVRPQISLSTQAIEPGNAGRFLAAAGIAQACMRFRLRRWSFADVIGAERGRHCDDRRVIAISEPSNLYGSFRALEAWFGEEDQCLARALAYRMIALARGFDASLVIGVKLDPFAAHCWVQSGPLLLNDRLERVRLFTPILAI